MAYPVTRRTVRYLGDLVTRKVHDLGNEWPRCDVDEILRAERGVGFIPDALPEARLEGFDPCSLCVSEPPDNGAPT